MDNKLEILLGSEKNIDSVNVDNYSRVELTVNASELTEFTVNDVVNSTEVFDAEREANQIYRIYGRIEYLSLLNGLKNDYSELEDFFTPQYGSDSKNLLNSFRFYIVAPHSADTYNQITGTDKYQRSFYVLTDQSDIEIYNAGFTNNVYGEQVYAFSFKVDFDVSEYYDKLGFPLTELFLYAQYIIDESQNESMSYTTWSLSTGNPAQTDLNTTVLEKGDDVEGINGQNIHDIIEYIPEEYLQTQVETQKFFIRTPYNYRRATWSIEWSYNPFIPLRLRYLDGVVSTAKLTEIPENSVSLEIYDINNTNRSISLTKSKKQSIIPTPLIITDWDAGSSPYFSWNPTTGQLTFLNSGTFDVMFTTKMYLPNGTDKYIGRTFFQINSDPEILSTRRNYTISDAVQGTHYVGAFNAGDVLKIYTRLIPNPNERKVEEIPDYALMLQSQGKYVWRDILPQGYVEPLTGVGVDYPFLNGKRYLFSPIILDVYPNLSEETWDMHQQTLTVFDEISFSKNATEIDTTPLTDLNDIEKPCQ